MADRNDQGFSLYSMTSFGVGFGLAGVVASLHDPVGLVIALSMLVFSALHEWACRKEAAESAGSETERG